MDKLDDIDDENDVFDDEDLDDIDDSDVEEHDSSEEDFLPKLVLVREHDGHHVVGLVTLTLVSDSAHFLSLTIWHLD